MAYWTLGNKTDTYSIGDIENVRDRKEKPSASFNNPAEDETETYIYTIQGMIRRVTLMFKIVNDGNNRASTGTAVTIDDQYDYLMNTVYKEGMDVIYELNGGPFSNTGNVEYIDIEMINDKPLYYRATVSFIIGQLVFG